MEDLLDVDGSELVAALVVGQVEADVEAELGEAGQADDAGGDAVDVEVGDHDQLLSAEAQLVELLDEEVHVLQLGVGGVVDLPDVLVGPPASFADEVIQALGHGGDLLSGCPVWRRGAGHALILS